MIKKIVIDKFKSINHLEITPAGNFNVLIGENNIGKTTIFEGHIGVRPHEEEMIFF